MGDQLNNCYATKLKVACVHNNYKFNNSPNIVINIYVFAICCPDHNSNISRSSLLSISNEVDRMKSIFWRYH